MPLQSHSPPGGPPHRAYVAPGHFAETEQEPLPDHCWQLVLGDGDKPKCPVEADQLQSVEAHVQLFMPARVNQCLHDEPGKATYTELFQGEDAVDFVPVRMQPDTCATAASVPLTTVPKMRSFAGLASCWG